MPPSGNPWSVKGIDPRARAIAKTAARREGMTLGEWLNRVILDDEPNGGLAGWDDKLSDFPGFAGNGNGDGGGDEDGALQEIVSRLANRMETAERRASLALSGVDQSVLGLSRRLEALEAEHEEGSEELDSALARSRAAQDELLERIRKLERTGPGQNGEAIKAVETALAKFAARLYETEREVRGELDTLALKEERRRETSDKAFKSLQQRLDETERKLSGEDAALKDLVEERHRQTGGELEAVQNTTRTLQQRLTAAEGATHRAAELLSRSHEKLEARLKDVESRNGDALSQADFQRRFDNLAGELADVIRTTRADFARQIDQVTSQGDTVQLRRALEQAENRIAGAEQRQGEQLARIGEQIGKLARAMERRLDETDRRLESRLMDAERGRRQSSDQAAIEARLAQVREENATAVKRMGEEVAKLGTSLADRVQQAEHRSASAMQAAGERMAQVVEKLQTRTTSPEQDLQSRITASEERTAKRIEDAMGKLHARLDAARTEQAQAMTPVQRAMSALADRLEAIEQRTGAGEAKPDKPEEPASTPAPATPNGTDAFEPLPVPPGIEPVAKGGDPFEIAGQRDGFVVDAETPVREPRRPREEVRPEPEPAPAKPRRAAALGATADTEFLNAARNSARGSRGSRADYSRFEPDQGEKSAGRGGWVLIGASVLSFLIIGAAAGLLILDTLTAGDQGTSEAAVGEDTLNSLFAESAPAESEAEPVPAAVEDAAPQPAASEPEAVPDAQPATVPAPAPAPARLQTAAASLPATLEQAAASGDPVARYQLGLERLEAGALEDAAALMRRAAEQGIPAAQFRYAQMLQRGEGVSANPQTARLWMVRAAQNGNVRAMHAAGAMHINAETTAGNQEEAARWFEQGALHGVRDSQFNLALLFQSGYGVPESPADAYAWFLIAAANGDEGAAGRAAELRRELSVEQRSAAEDVAASFTPRPVDVRAQGRYPDWTAPDDAAPALVLRAQQLLAGLGYDAGPADGDFGQQTREAIVAYQTDQGLEPTGAVDTRLIASLEQTTPR